MLTKIFSKNDLRDCCFTTSLVHKIHIVEARLDSGHVEREREISDVVGEGGDVVPVGSLGVRAGRGVTVGGVGDVPGARPGAPVH